MALETTPLPFGTRLAGLIASHLADANGQLARLVRRAV